MSLGQKDVAKLAHLARIGSKSSLTDLERIVSMFSQLTSIDTEGVEPMSHPLDLSQCFRTDSISEENVREEMLNIAPEGCTAAGLYLVPKVIE